MARPKILRGTYVNVLMSDAATPAVFYVICGLTTRDFTNQMNTSDAFVRDCAIPTDIPTRSVIASGQQWDITGSGWMNRSLLSKIDAVVGVLNAYRFELAQPAGDLVYGGYYSGIGIMTQKKITGEDADFAKIDLTIAGDGPWTFTAV